MIFLVYVSTANTIMTDEELEEILAVSRRNNARQEITGMLLYNDGSFMQALEGPTEAVESLHDTIMRDTRHHGMITLIKGELRERQFDGWAMGFKDISGDMAGKEGFENILQLTEKTDKDGVTHITYKLLMNFKQQVR